MESIVPEGFIGEQYRDDVALIFKVKKKLVDKKTKYQKVDIVETDSYGQILFLDGLLMKDAMQGHIINEMQIHVPMTVAKDAKKVLVVGGGEGFAATILLQYPKVEQIDVIDIDAEFVEIAKEYYPDQTKSFEDPKVNVIIMDGLEYLKQTKEKYDVIFCVPTDPLTISDPLFVDEFYQKAYDCLTDNGIYLTDSYMPFYQYGKVDYAYIHKKLKKYFPICKLFNCTIPTFPGGLFTFVIASKKYDPETEVGDLPEGIKCKYYNKETHKASFVMPQFMLDAIKE